MYLIDSRRKYPLLEMNLTVMMDWCPIAALLEWHDAISGFDEMVEVEGTHLMMSKMFAFGELASSSDAYASIVPVF